jgi:hypothetical protein
VTLPTLSIVPGHSKPFRLAFVGPGDRFEPLAEFDTSDAALAAKRAAEAATITINAKREA